ncbi:MAG TPA: YceI family protein [Povalibacter sp.]|nr:YceI family protein [Povalibacter sp.]
MHPFTRILPILGLACLLMACPQTTRPPAPEKPSLPSVPAVDLRGATIYRLNPQLSVAHILVYRGGVLARLGHNHVMTARDLSGRVWIQPTLARSGFRFSFPVAAMVVDDPQARRAAGSDFPPDVSQADRDGTRKNMLLAEVLDAESHPTIALESVHVAGTLQAPQLTARITIKQASRDVPVTAAVKIEGARLTANGEFDIRQTDFGIEPFSAALGALTVQDRLTVRFSIVAEQEVATTR